MGVSHKTEIHHHSEKSIEAKAAAHPNLHHFAMERTSPDLERLHRANEIAIKNCVDSMCNAVKALPSEVRNLLLDGFTAAQQKEPLYAAIISANRNA